MIDKQVTHLAVLDVTPQDVRVVERLAGLTAEELQSPTGAQFHFG